MRERIEIGIIPNDSSHKETIIQIANRLDDLQLAVSHIFQAIDNKLETYNKRLLGVREKASKLQNQLLYLQNNMSLKAIKMYSDAKYPADKTYEEYQTITGVLISQQFNLVDTNKSNISPESTLIHNPMEPTMKADLYTAELNLKEKLQFYYVMSKPLSENNPAIWMNESPITRVSSVSALLIDDSDISDRFSHFLHSIPHNTQQMEDAPDSIVQPWHLSDFESPSYLYAPILGEVPQINVPAILPDLPGIVDDEKFVLDLSFQSPINPSSAVTSPTSSRVDLPNTVSSTKQEDKLSQIQDNSLILPTIVDQGYTISLSQQLSSRPPPPTLPLSAIQIEQSTYNVVTPILPEVQNISAIANPPPPPPPPIPTPPPPPPPPPPSSLPVELQSSEHKVQVKKASSQPKSTMDDRTNLMAAIRAAGGVGKAKLRPAASSVESPSDRWSSASVGGDLMADLHAKLSLRRKGIAGGGMGALERISRLIPPPPKPIESDRNSASENDSQPDADDWE